MAQDSPSSLGGVGILGGVPLHMFCYPHALLIRSGLPSHLSKVFSFPTKVLHLLTKGSPRCLKIPETAFHFGLCPCLVPAVCLPLGWLWIRVCRAHAQPHLAVVSARLSRIVFCLHGCRKMGAAPPQPRGWLGGAGAPGAALDQWVGAPALRSLSWDDSLRHAPRAFLPEVSSGVGLQVELQVELLRCLPFRDALLPSPTTVSPAPSSRCTVFIPCLRVRFGGSPAESSPLCMPHRTVSRGRGEASTSSSQSPAQCWPIANASATVWPTDGWAGWMMEGKMDT